MNNLLSCRYNMDTDRVEARFADGSAVAIDCIAIEDKYGNTPAQRAELDWLLYNKPLEYAQLVLGGEMEHYLALGCKTQQTGRLTPSDTTVPRLFSVLYRKQSLLFDDEIISVLFKLRQQVSPANGKTQQSDADPHKCSTKDITGKMNI